MVRYEWTQRVERHDERIHVLQLFNDLFWFDMMQLLRPRGSGRVGGVMRDELNRYLTPFNFEELNLDKEDVMANVGDWSVRGAQINKLCTPYGSSVVLVLHRELSRDLYVAHVPPDPPTDTVSLEGKFTVSGAYFEGAIARLKSTGIERVHR